MNLLEVLAREHSKAQCDRIVRYIGKDQQRFADLVTVFLAGPYRITQRASWPLNYCVELHPSLIDPHLKRIVRNLRKPGIHDAVKRNTLRLLQFVVIPESLQGLVVDTCIELFRNAGEPIAVKVFSMSVLVHIAQRQPELKNEVALLIEEQMPYGSAGFLSRARRVLKQLKG